MPLAGETGGDIGGASRFPTRAVKRALREGRREVKGKIGKRKRPGNGLLFPVTTEGVHCWKGRSLITPHKQGGEFS